MKESGTFSVFSRPYWREATSLCRSVRHIVFAALIVALRVALKAFRIPLAPGLSLTFDCYVNSLGSLVYGPVLALFVGAISDTLGALIFPSGIYFFPFILTEMSSSLLFSLFLWRREVRVGRVLAAKFTVNLFCNIFLTSLLMKWYYAIFYSDKAYAFINVARIVKNLALFPAESMLIVWVLGALIPALRACHLLPAEQQMTRATTRDIILLILLTLLSIGIVLFYIFFLKGFLEKNNIKFW